MSKDNQELLDATRNSKKRESERDVDRLMDEVTNVQLESIEDEETPQVSIGFLARLQHELRTPTTGILGMSQMLGLESLDPEHDEMVGVIERCARDLERTLNDVFEYASLISPKVLVDRSDFDLADLLRDLHPQVQRACEEDGLRLSWNVPDGFSQHLFEDRSRLDEVLWQIADNAIKFTDHGEVEISVRDRGDDGVVILVRDTGPGFAVPVRDVLKPFTQGDNTHTRTHGGCGLGLSIVHRICAIMDWSLRILSVPDKGSTVGLGLKRG